MKTTDIKHWGMNLIGFMNDAKKEHRLFVLLMLIWSGITSFLDNPEMTAGINQSVPLMVVLALITFLLLLELSWWLFIRFWLGCAASQAQSPMDCRSSQNKPKQ